MLLELLVAIICAGFCISTMRPDRTNADSNGMSVRQLPRRRASARLSRLRLVPSRLRLSVTYLWFDGISVCAAIFHMCRCPPRTSSAHSIMSMSRAHVQYMDRNGPCKSRWLGYFVDREVEEPSGTRRGVDRNGSRRLGGREDGGVEICRVGKSRTLYTLADARGTRISRSRTQSITISFFLRYRSLDRLVVVQVVSWSLRYRSPHILAADRSAALHGARNQIFAAG